MNTAATSQLTERQRTILARFTDWNRPAWCGLKGSHLAPLIALGLLEQRSVAADHNASAFEYRLTAAGAEAIKEKRA